MKLQRVDKGISSEHLEDMKDADTVYRAQRQRGGMVEVLYIYWDGKEHRCFGCKHDKMSHKYLGETTDNSFMHSISQALENNEKVGISLTEVMSGD